MAAVQSVSQSVRQSSLSSDVVFAESFSDTGAANLHKWTLASISADVESFRQSWANNRNILVNELKLTFNENI